MSDGARGPSDCEGDGGSSDGDGGSERPRFTVRGRVVALDEAMVALPVRTLPWQLLAEVWTLGAMGCIAGFFMDLPPSWLVAMALAAVLARVLASRLATGFVMDNRRGLLVGMLGLGGRRWAWRAAGLDEVVLVAVTGRGDGVRGASATSTTVAVLRDGRALRLSDWLGGAAGWVVAEENTRALAAHLGVGCLTGEAGRVLVVERGEDGAVRATLEEDDAIMRLPSTVRGLLVGLGLQLLTRCLGRAGGRREGR